MDRREQIGDQEEQLRGAMEAHQSGLWTAIPGIIQSFDASAMTCTVQPAISGRKMEKDGSFSEFRMPVLLDCPVVFPGGGGCVLTFPLAAGDECLVVFASRCIDAWWKLGGIQGPTRARMHSLSDGFAIPGPRSQPRKVTASTLSAQLRTDGGEAVVEIVTSSKAVNITTTGTATIQAPSIILKNTGAALKKLCTDLFMTLYNTHRHGGGPPPDAGYQAVPGTHTTNIVQAE